MGFFKSLLSADGEVSSKRFAGLCLIGTFIVIVILAAIGGNCPEEVESLAKTSLYVGGTLLGASLLPDMIKNAQRPAPVVVDTKKEENDKSK